MRPNFDLTIDIGEASPWLDLTKFCTKCSDKQDLVPVSEQYRHKQRNNKQKRVRSCLITMYFNYHKPFVIAVVLES